MKSLVINRSLFAVASIFVLASCTQDTERDGTNESLTGSVATDIKQSSESPPGSGEAVDKKLDSLLSRLAKNPEKMLVQDPQNIASQLSIKNGMVAVEVTYEQPQVAPESLQAFKDLGGQVDTVFLNKLYGWIPVDKIRLAAQPEAVWSISAAAREAYPIGEKGADKGESNDQKPVSVNSNTKEETNNEN